MKLIAYLVICIDFVSLPIAYSKSVLIFLIMLLISAAVVFNSQDTVEERCFKLYLWSISFFGISISGIKIFDLVMIISLIIFFIHHKYIVVNKSLNLILFFYLFIILQCVYLFLTGYKYMNDSIPELERYLLSLTTTLLFIQLVNKIDVNKIIKWLDKLSFLIILQALVMFVVQGSLTAAESSVGPVSIQVFSDDSESRISAFFSDPNKMMCYFLILLLIRILLETAIHGKNIKWHWQYLIYLIGAVISLARTSVISVILFILLFLCYRYLFRNNIQIGNFLLFMVTLIVFLLIIQFQTAFFTWMDHFFESVLEVFGRTRTAQIDGNMTTDSRVLVWREAFNYIKQSPLFGNGLLSESNLLPIPTHNTVIQLLLDTGLIGILLYITGIFRPILEVVPFWLVLATMIIPMLFLDLGNFRLIFVVLGIAMQYQTIAGGEI